MYLVTGGAGFIGSHIIRALNARGIDDVVVVDDLARGDKWANLSDCRIADYIDKAELRAALDAGRFDAAITRVLHQGACTDTTERDGRYLLDNNFTFSKLLLRFALERGVPFVYASSAAVYGAAEGARDRSAFAPVPVNERPINPYGYSKLAFDQHVRHVGLGAGGAAASTVVGLRYFNVYGPREVHKGRMASMVYQIHRQVLETGRVRLFEGTAGFDDGAQRRDFVYVEDVVDVNLAFADGPPRRGIVNVGSGSSHSFNEVAERVIARHGRGAVEYVPFDEALRGRYQSFTEADLTGLRALGYARPFTALDDGITRSVAAWTPSGLVDQPVA